MCSACATIRPRASKSAVEQSRRSLMFAENADRTSTAPISSATARRALPSTCSSMFTLFSRLDHEFATPWTRLDATLRRWQRVPEVEGLADPSRGKPPA